MAAPVFTRIIDRAGLGAAAALLRWDQNGDADGDDITFGNNDFLVGTVTITPTHILTGANGRKLNTLTLMNAPAKYTTPGEMVLATRRAGARREPLVIDSDTDLTGAGTDILSGTNGPFTVELKSFDRHGNALFSASRKSAGDPVFLGVTCDQALIAWITLDIAPLDRNGLFINQLSFSE